MIFSTIQFTFIFLPIVVVLYFLFQKLSHNFSKFFLIIASLVYYSYWNWRYLWVILLSVVFNYLIGRSLNKSSSKSVLTFGVILNLSFLAYFKYFNFFIENVNYLTQASLNFEKIALPLAISFFTFQQIAYIVDIFRNNNVKYKFLDYSLFVVFFPQLIAGPIVHHKDLTPQFNVKEKIKKFSWDNLYFGFSIFVIGLTKKMLIADNLSANVSKIYDKNDIIPSFSESWISTLSYTFQLYYDFSGYSDMAIGIALMIGINLPLNFNSPYKSKNIIEFWRRWHITLSSFLRDYLYIPLGGNRHGKLRKNINLLTTMLLGGLWHGAGWNFIIWGGLHGLYLVINNFWRRIYIGKSKVYNILSILLTFIASIVAWVFFRAQTFDQAINILKGMISKFDGLKSLEDIYILCAVAAITFLAPNTQEIRNLKNLNIHFLITFVCSLISVYLLLFNSNQVYEFLYYDF